MMNFKRYALVAVAAMILSPSTGKALEPTATMFASCFADCEYVRFSLYFDDGLTLEELRVVSDVDYWRFADVVSVRYGTTDIAFTEDIGPNANYADILIGNLPNASAISPLNITVQMNTSAVGFSASNSLIDGSLWFTGDVCTNENISSCNESFPQRTNVTPEPVTMALLGTGLAGLAGVGARRKKRFPTDSE